ncbi:MAG: hypothetical protein ACO3DD_09580 [Burkholderiaceae bacterium]
MRRKGLDDASSSGRPEAEPGALRKKPKEKADHPAAKGEGGSMAKLLNQVSHNQHCTMI